MTSKTFTTGTVIDKDWLNDVDAATYEGAAIYTPAGTGAVATTVQAKLRESVSVKDFGAKGDGVTDDLAAFNAAIASFGASSTGGSIYVPTGTYYLSGQISISKRISLIGAGNGENGAAPQYGSSTLKFAANTTGIRVFHSSDSSDGKDGSWSVIRGLLVTAASKLATGHGIHISGHQVSVENCTVWNFAQNGINIVANAGVGNANNTYVVNSRCVLNGGNGIYVDGSDANAGSFVNVDCSNNGGWGFYDSSFLGNTYIACHTASNTSGSYKTDDNNAQNVFIGCYAETGQTAASLVWPTVVYGGSWQNGMTGSAGWLSNSSSGMQLNNQWPLLPTGGLSFQSTTKSSNVNYLDAYVEGTWTPTVTNMTVVGTPTYAGSYTRIGNRVYFEIAISVSGGTTAATANSTYMTLPIIPVAKGVAVASNAVVGNYGTSLIDTNAGGVVWTPTWVATANTVFVSGQYQCSSTA